jgi:hypothetical protein
MSTKGPARLRRERSAQESLGSIVLGFELVVVFLGTLVVFGLHALPPAPALTGGAVLIVLMIVAIPLLRFRVGYWLGWFVQLVVIASGFLVAMLFIVGAIFAAIWAYSMIAGARLDRRKAEYLAAGEAAQGGDAASGPPGTSDSNRPSDSTDKESE